MYSLLALISISLFIMFMPAESAKAKDWRTTLTYKVIIPNVSSDEYNPVFLYCVID